MEFLDKSCKCLRIKCLDCREEVKFREIFVKELPDYVVTKKGKLINGKKECLCLNLKCLDCSKIHRM